MREAPTGRGVAGAARTVGRGVVRLPGLALVTVFRTWQVVVSPTYGQTCRFYPSCSAYGVESVRIHGAVRGLALTGWRILRCNPWNGGGVDHVPPVGEFRRAFRGHEAENNLNLHTHETTTADDVPAAAVACPDEASPGPRRAA